MYSTVLFDFDGTLVSSLSLWTRAYQFALSGFGFEIDLDEVKSTCFYRHFADICESYKIADVAEFRTQMNRGLHEAFTDAQLFTAARECLITCRELGMKTGLVTSSELHLVEPALSKLSLDTLLDTVVTGCQVAHCKPHPEPIHRALASLRSTAETTLFVGDYEVDVVAGKAAGVTTALFFPAEHEQYYSLARLTSTNPHLIFHDYQDLISHLRASEV